MRERITTPEFLDRQVQIVTEHLEDTGLAVVLVEVLPHLPAWVERFGPILVEPASSGPSTGLIWLRLQDAPQRRRRAARSDDIE